LSSSPFNDFLGLHWVSWVEGEAVAELDLREEHLNRSGSLHGGVMCTLLDAVCSRSGCWAPEGAPLVRASTVSLTTNFLRGATAGVVRATGRHRPGGGTQIFSAVGELMDAEGRVLALAQGTFRYRPKAPVTPA
jgi:uncharacterized protein (TIGR00369 family)